MSTDLIAAAPPEEGALTTRCRIIETARTYFRDVGYRKTTVADIARTLRMSPANVYRFFDSKKAINEAVIERLVGEVEAVIAGIAAAPGRSAAERVAAVIEALHHDTAERFRAHPRMHEMVEAAMDESWQVCGVHVERLTAVFERLVAEGVAAGEFAAQDPATAGRCLHAATARYTHPLLARQDIAAPTPPLPAMTAFLLAALRPAQG